MQLQFEAAPQCCLLLLLLCCTARCCYRNVQSHHVNQHVNPEE